ncbi:MAG: GNAT family N-acetyltransferase [Oscillospiraceae bacterium]|nr:GNAT family N-acetyltransferase [Oscillospiraceae bacterium]
MGIYIRKLSKKDKEDKVLFDFVTSISNEDTGFTNPWEYIEEKNSFNEWIDIMLKSSKGEYKAKCEVKKYSLYWIYSEDIPVGVGKVREPDEEEIKHYGHIGYYIDSKYRGKGYATEAVRLLVEEAKKTQKIEEVMIFIRIGNLSSRRVVEKCGGELREIVDDKACKYYL